ncbi:MAG: hypothetical protein ACPH3M_05600, partial [Candidatus Puniceispirillales bacterium]
MWFRHDIAVHTQAATGNQPSGHRSGFEKSRRPQPFIQPHCDDIIRRHYFALSFARTAKGEFGSMGLLAGDLLAGDLCADLFGRPVAPSPAPPLPEPLALFLALFFLEWGIASGDEALAELLFAFAGRSNNAIAGFSGSSLASSP